MRGRRYPTLVVAAGLLISGCSMISSSQSFHPCTDFSDEALTAAELIPDSRQDDREKDNKRDGCTWMSRDKRFQFSAWKTSKSAEEAMVNPEQVVLAGRDSYKTVGGNGSAVWVPAAGGAIQFAVLDIATMGLSTPPGFEATVAYEFAERAIPPLLEEIPA